MGEISISFLDSDCISTDSLRFYKDNMDPIEYNVAFDKHTYEKLGGA